MGRIFDEHSVRCVRSLNGTWRFVTDPEAKGEMRSYANTLPHNATEVYVPSMWNNTFGLLEYEGVAWYERGFETAGGCVRIHFGAVMTEAKVYVDGEFVLTADPHAVGWTHSTAQIAYRGKENTVHTVEIRKNPETMDKKFTILGFGYEAPETE